MKNNFNATLYLVRHGETLLNLKKVIQGHSDSPLSQNGKNQAQNLKIQFKDILIDEYYSSDLGRAIATVEIIKNKSKKFYQDKNLRERMYGRFEGKSLSELKTFDCMFNKVSEHKRMMYKPFSDIESDGEVAKRMLNFIKEISIPRNNNKTILAVTHSGSIRSLLLYLNWSNYLRFPPNAITHAAYVKVLIKNDNIKIDGASGIILS